MKLNLKSLKEIDWKQFFIEKGERVGLALTAVLMVTLTAMSLFLPDHGFRVPGPDKNAEVLKTATDSVEQRLASAVPGKEDLPPEIPAVPVAFKHDLVKDPKIYEVPTRFLPPATDSTKRRMPELFQPDEGTATVVLSQIRSYIVDSGMNNIMILEGDVAGSTPTGTPRNNAASVGSIGAIRGARGGGGGAPPGPAAPPAGGAGAGPGGRRGGAGGAGGPGSRQQAALRPQSPGAKTRFVPIEEITEAKLSSLAEEPRPLRQAIVCATFPYRKQLEEFARKLRLDSPREVLQEVALETSPEGLALPSFRFLGVDVQRRTIGPDGKPGEWQTLDIKSILRQFIIVSGQRFEPNPPDLESRGLIVDGLWMPLLRQFDENPNNSYPAVEKELLNVQKTLKELEGTDEQKIVKPKNPILDKDDFDPFKAATNQRTLLGVGPANRGGVPAAPAAAPGATGVARATGGGGGGRGALAAAASAGLGPDGVIPEYVVVRVVDVTVEPGNVYQYRLHVRMANPNFGHTADVLSPSYGVEKELCPERDRKDSDWFVVPKKVSVPPEFHYYAVDQKDLDKQAGGVYRGIHWRDTPTPGVQAVFQIQRWLENFTREKGNANLVQAGEWVVAERVLVSRGEYVGRTEKVNVPYWDTSRASFLLAMPTAGTKQKLGETGIDVDFSLPNDDAILVDFDPGTHSYERRVTRDDDKVDTVKFEDKTSGEYLLLLSDGRVTAHNNLVDAKNKDRLEHLKQWRERVVTIRQEMLATPSNVPTNPFGPAGQPGMGGGGGRPGIGRGRGPG